MNTKMNQIKPFFVTAESQDEVSCVVKLPKEINKDTRVFVAVHGISRTPMEQIILFSEFAIKNNLVLVAPFFDDNLLKSFQEYSGKLSVYFAVKLFFTLSLACLSQNLAFLPTLSK